MVVSPNCTRGGNNTFVLENKNLQKAAHSLHLLAISKKGSPRSWQNRQLPVLTLQNPQNPSLPLYYSILGHTTNRGNQLVLCLL